MQRHYMAMNKKHLTAKMKRNKLFLLKLKGMIKLAT